MELAVEKCHICDGSIPLHYFKSIETGEESSTRWLCQSCNDAYVQARTEAKINIYDIGTRRLFASEYLQKLGK